MTLTDEIKRLRDLEVKATKGWVVTPQGHPKKIVKTGPHGYLIAEFYANGKQEGETEANAELAVRTRNALPKLLDELEQAKKVLEFYAGHSKSEAKRLQVMDGGVLAHTLLKKWGAG